MQLLAAVCMFCSTDHKSEGGKNRKEIHSFIQSGWWYRPLPSVIWIVNCDDTYLPKVRIQVYDVCCYVFTSMKEHDGFHWFSDVPKCAIFKAKFYVGNNYRSPKVFETTVQRVWMWICRIILPNMYYYQHYYKILILIFASVGHFKKI